MWVVFIFQQYSKLPVSLTKILCWNPSSHFCLSPSLKDVFMLIFFFLELEVIIPFHSNLNSFLIDVIINSLFFKVGVGRKITA